MYRIYADDTLVYDSTCEDYRICKGTVTLEAGKAGSFVFAIYPEHFYYDKFVKMRTAVTVYKDDRIVFRGRVLNDTVDHWNCKTLTCEGELAFLNDSVIRPFKEFRAFPEDVLAQLVAWHNEQVDEFKRFKVGRVTVPGAGSLLMRPASTNYDTAMAAMTEHLLGAKPGGQLYVTHEDGDRIPTLNWIADYDVTASQAIEFGENLKQYTKTAKAEELATAIIPLGATIDDGNDGTEDKRLTIKTSSHPDYVYSPEGVALYGWIFKVVEWSDIADRDELYEAAVEHLADVCGQNITVELNAIDLHLMDRSIESFNVCEYVQVVSEPHNFAATLLCNKQTLDLLKPQNDTVVLGSAYSSFTEKSTKTTATLVKVSQSGASKVSQTVAELTTRVDVLEQGGGVGVMTIVSGQSVSVSDVSPFKHDLIVSVLADNPDMPLETTLVYNGKEYPTAADGSVEGLVSTSPNMTLSVPTGYELTLVYYKKK